MGNMTLGSTSKPLTSTVWWAHTSAAARGEARLQRLLNEEERARNARLRLPADRDRHLLGRAMARLALAEHAGCSPEKVGFELRCPSCEEKERTGASSKDDTPHGKPHPSGPAEGWEISISHSGEWVALALTRQARVGIDVERVTETRDLEGLAGYTLADVEHDSWQGLTAGARPGAFFGYWARKEAVLKATGLGLSGGLRRVAVTPPHNDARLLSWDGGGGPDAAWLSDLDRGADYRSAVAVLTDEPVELIVHPPEVTAYLLR